MDMAGGSTGSSGGPGGKGSRSWFDKVFEGISFRLPDRYIYIYRWFYYPYTVRNMSRARVAEVV